MTGASSQAATRTANRRPTPERHEQHDAPGQTHAPASNAPTGAAHPRPQTTALDPTGLARQPANDPERSPGIPPTFCAPSPTRPPSSHSNVNHHELAP